MLLWIRPLSSCFVRHSFTTSSTVAAGMVQAGSVDTFIESFNSAYESKHKAYEDCFWATKMNLKNASAANLTKTKAELDAFLGDTSALATVRQWLSSPSLTDDHRRTLELFERTIKCYVIENEDARAIRQRIDALEAELASERNMMKLQYVDGNGTVTPASSVQLRNVMRTDQNETVRKSCYQGMRSIGTFIVPKFCEIVLLRNKLARLLGYQCFYDMKVSQAEGFNKHTLFTILDALEERSRPLMEHARKNLGVSRGPDALNPWNTGFALSGAIDRMKDPYFPFENAVDVWARSFAGMGITYSGATMRMDLCDRPGKYSNGFCHWPQPAWVRSHNDWVPSQANLTSLASPKQVGSGHTALITLMHEGGHAAHFANVKQHSPLFSQERAPTSVAYAETQSMFLDSLVGDATWMGRFALSRTGEPIPFSTIEADLLATHPYKVFALRSMLAVPFFERRLYELPDDQVTVDGLLALSDDVEYAIQGGLSSRPLLSIPHILSDESAAYYHGYVLADMAVHQTRAHFLSKYQTIVDNPQIGADLDNIYWRPGNSVPFMDLVQNMTAKALSGDAWVAMLEEDVHSKIAQERSSYDAAVSQGPRFAFGADVSKHLDMRVILVHGDEVVADSVEDGGLTAACKRFKHWVAKLDF